MSEDALILGCIKNDAAAQRELYQRYSPKMLSICFRYAHSKEDAEDMLQDGFVKVFTQLKAFENRGSFEGWIRKIIVHTCINMLKKNKKFDESIELQYAAGQYQKEEGGPANIQVKEVIDSIRLLPLGYRTVLNLFAIEGYSHREISKMLDIQESTSRSQFTRAKALLEDILIKRNIISKPKQEEDWLVAVGQM